MPSSISVLPLLTSVIAADILINCLPVRVHTRISRYPWARLWFLCRAMDGDGTGRIVLPFTVAQSFLSCSEKSIYRWLQQGKKVGAFRRYSPKTGEIWLGSMFNVCRSLNLKYWGAVGVCSLSQVLSLRQMRAMTTAIVTQKFQQKSRYAANSKLKPEHRKLYGSPHPNELFGSKEQSSPKLAVGQLPFVLHISEKRVFVSKNFVHFGTSQNAISCELGIHTRTVRRHQQFLGLDKRQICQHKREYGWVKTSWEHDSKEYWATDSTKQTHIGYQASAEAIAFFDGIPLGAKKQQPNSYQIPAGEFDGRFFKMGNKVWMNRCNIYREDFTLTTMAAARRKYRHKLSQCQISENRAGGVAHD